MRDEWFNFYNAIYFTNSSFGAFLETAHCWMEETAGCVDLACKSATCSWSDLIASSIWTLTLPVLPVALSCRRESKTNGSHMHEMNLNDFIFFYLQAATKILTTTEKVTKPYARRHHPFRVIEREYELMP